jgi:hypothetical protein
MDVQTQAHALSLDILAPCVTSYAQLDPVTPTAAN